MGRQNQQQRFDPDGRKEKAMEDIRSTLSKEELERIRQTREFNELRPGTLSYKVALFNDQLRQNRISEETRITQRLLTMRTLQDHVSRMKFQLKDGIITEELKDKVTMTVEELTTQLRREQWLIEGEAVAIIRSLAELRSVVEHKDLAGNIIMFMEEFDNYAEKTIEEIKSHGINLFAKYNL